MTAKGMWRMDTAWTAWAYVSPPGFSPTSTGATEPLARSWAEPKCLMQTLSERADRRDRMGGDLYLCPRYLDTYEQMGCSAHAAY